MTSRPTILIVDDDASIRLLLSAAYSDRAEVVTVADGAAALAFTEDRIPDVAVVDAMMPDIDGLDVVRTWRGAERTADMDIIVLSARDRPVDQAAGYEAGADAYVTKPMDLDVLWGLIAAMLEEHSTQQQAVLDEFRSLQMDEFPDAPAG